MTHMTDPRPSWDDYFADIARAVALRADCTRRQVGCVLVINNRIIGTGYNGAAPGQPGCLSAGACPRGRFTREQVAPLGDYDRPGTDSFCIAVHGEVNALLFATRDTSGSTAYITDPPCPGCRKALAVAGVVRVVYPGGEMSAADLIDWTVMP